MSLRAFTPESGRQSPFKRQNSSASTSSVRATTPTPTSPIKSSNYSPTKPSSLSPEKTSPFVRRPSQINQTSPRPSSPLATPNGGLSIPTSPTRQSGYASSNGDTPAASPRPVAVMRMSEEDVNRRDTASPSPSPFDGPTLDSPSVRPLFQAGYRSTPPRSDRASSTTSTIKAPTFTTSTPKSIASVPKLTNATSGYNHVPPPLLRSMRESFEVLDSSNTGNITSASVSSMLEQMGLPNTPADVRDYFPPNNASQLNLARYLDILSGPLAELSQTEELAAAFSAFDVDDSGQIDVAELRKALLNTAPEPGEEMIRLSEREIDGILGEFAGRRAFGAKGVNVAKGKGDVFRWREFMGSISGGGGADAGQEGVAAA